MAASKKPAARKTVPEGGSPTHRIAPDWQAVERDYRAGIMSLREMAAAHSVSHVSIKKHADKAGWTRDLSAQIQAKADALVNKAAVNRSANTAGAVSDREVIEANAARIAKVRGEHRADITRMRTLVLDMLGELERTTGNADLFEQLGEMLRSEDDRGQDKRNEIYTKVISSAGRIDSLKKLAETLKVLIALEREAYGIDKGFEPSEKARSFAEFYGALIAKPASP